MKEYSNDLGHLLLCIIVNPCMRAGHLDGILPQIWPRIAGILAGLKFGNGKVYSPAIPRPLIQMTSALTGKMTLLQDHDLNT